MSEQQSLALPECDPSQRHSHRLLLNAASPRPSHNTTMRELPTPGISKMAHALSARRLHNGPQFTLSQLLQGEIRGRSKLTSEAQQEGTRRERSSHPHLLEQGKSANKTLTSLLEGKEVRVRCRQCEQSFKTKEREVEALVKEVRQWQGKFNRLQDKHDELRKRFEPYVNNLTLLTAVVDSLQEKEKEVMFVSQDVVATGKGQENRSAEAEEQAARVNRWLLREGRQRDKFYHSQTFRLNCQVDSMRGENTQLRGCLQAKDSKIRGLEEQLRYYQCNNSMRERLEMCREELYSYKLKYQQRREEAQALERKLQQSRYKLTVLTSLIGCAIIFDLKEKDRDKASLKEFINRIDHYHSITHNYLENNGLQHLKFYDTARKTHFHHASPRRERTDSKDTNKGSEPSHPSVVSKTVQYRKLYLPNYLALLDEQSIAARAQHVIIKPLLFIKIRAILDSKYIDYRLFEANASSFPEFCSSYLKNYDILQAEKKPYLLIRQISENEIKEMSVEFFKCLLDERIQDLAEVEVFREFLLGKWEEDEVYFYLMCRHKFLQGSELENFINSGDPSKLLRYDKAKRLLLRLTQGFGRSVQNFICHHVNQRRISKAGQQFVRLYYLLKVLLLIYRKVRAKRVEEFKECFESVLSVTRKNTLTFLQFCELLKKNFDFLPRAHACSMYRTTCALFESQKSQPNFYQCFVAACLPRLFLMELVRQDKHLELECMSAEQILTFTSPPRIERRGSIPNNDSRPSSQFSLSSQMRLSNTQYRNTPSGFKSAPRVNPLNELWPDSVYILGSETLNKQYVQLLKSNSWQQPRAKLEILSLLGSLAQGHLIKQNIFLREREPLGMLLSDAIFNLIEFLNRIEKQKIEYENEVSLASRKIGRFFKNKVYQFYHQMLEDVNAIKAKPTASPQQTPKKEQKTKRYFKEKIRASKVFGAFKLN